MRILLRLSAASLFLIFRECLGDNITPELTGISIVLFTEASFELVVLSIRNRRLIALHIRCYFYRFIQWRKDHVRLTISYIFRIERNGKYLLVYSQRRRIYQPVGGVYKYFENARLKLESMGMEADSKVPVDDDSRNDLRLMSKSAAQIPKFIRWFLSAKQRETDPWREFFEELVETECLQRNSFSYLFSYLVGQDIESIHDDPFHKVPTVKLCDIFVPNFNQEQKMEIEALPDIDPKSRFIWVTREEIAARHTKNLVNNFPISDHAYKMFTNELL